MSEKLLQKYYLRLKTEGFVKALLWGLAIGFGALTVFGMLFWIMNWGFAWVCLPIWAVVSACASIALYYWRFKPTTKSIARRVDDLGLHERILTMTELEGDESYIAQRQREDALASLTTIRADLLKVGVSKQSLITLGAATVFGVFAFLCASGVVTEFSALHPAPMLTYKITYAVKDGVGGTIEGKAEQTVEVGEYTTGVTAVPEEGWLFFKWYSETEESFHPHRSDKSSSNVTYYAVFIEANLGSIMGMPEDMPSDAPGDGEEEGDSEQSDSPPNTDQGQEPMEEPAEKVIDNTIMFGNMYGEAYKDALEDLLDEKYSEEQKLIGNGYFENVEREEEVAEEEGTK